MIFFLKHKYNRLGGKQSWQTLILYIRVRCLINYRSHKRNTLIHILFGWDFTNLKTSRIILETLFTLNLLNLFQMVRGQVCLSACCDNLQCLPYISYSLTVGCVFLISAWWFGVSYVHSPAGYATPKASWIPNRERERLIPVLPQVPAALHPIFPSFFLLLIPLSQLH